MCDFRADYLVLYFKGRTVVTAPLGSREPGTEKLGKLAV